MPKSKGPPYDIKSASAEYLVVINPWGMNCRTSSDRQPRHVDNCGAWVSFMLKHVAQVGPIRKQEKIVECIFMMKAREEIIVQLPQGTQVSHVLGRHRWSAIVRNWTGGVPEDETKSSYVFKYDYQKNGEPSNHNWTAFFPRVLAEDAVPAKKPYPFPTWVDAASFRGSHIKNLIIPMPEYEYRPLEPETENEPETELPKLEEDDIKPARIKTECKPASTGPRLYQPSEELQQLLGGLARHELQKQPATSTRGSGVKSEPVATPVSSSWYQPSEGLMNSITKYESQKRTTTPQLSIPTNGIKLEPVAFQASRLQYQPSDVLVNSITHYESHKRTVAPQLSVQGDRGTGVKSEPVATSLSSPRYQPSDGLVASRLPNGILNQGSGTRKRAVTMEPDSDVPDMKKIKTERT